MTDHLALAGEVFYQTASMTGGPDSAGFPLGSRNTTGFNFSGTYDINAAYHLLFSFGRGLDNTVTNNFSYCLALQLRY